MGRRLHPRPAPGTEELASRTVHEIVRDYPETLAALRRMGIDIAAEGGRRLGELPDRDRIVEALRAVTRWRPDPPTSPLP